MDMVNSGPHLTGLFALNKVAANKEVFMSAVFQPTLRLRFLSIRRIAG